MHTNRISCTNQTAHDFNSGDGKSVSAVLLNQHYYEYTLDWDFERIWQWNDATGYPELRQLPALAPDAAHQPPIHQKKQPVNQPASAKYLALMVCLRLAFAQKKSDTLYPTDALRAAIAWQPVKQNTLKCHLRLRV